MWIELNDTQKAMVMDDFFAESFRGDVDAIDAFISHRIEEMGQEYSGMLWTPTKEELQGIRARLKKMLREVDAADIRGGWEE